MATGRKCATVEEERMTAIAAYYRGRLDKVVDDNESLRVLIYELLEAPPQEQCDVECTEDNCPWAQARALLAR